MESKHGDKDFPCQVGDRGRVPLQEINTRSNDDHSTPEVSTVCNAREEPPAGDVSGAPAHVHVPDGGWGWMVVVGAGINSLLMGAMLQTMGIIYLQIRERYQVSATSAVWVGGLFQLFSGLGTPIAAWLVQKYSSRKVAFAGTIINCLGIFATSYAPNVYIVFFTYGFIPGVGTCLLHTASYLHVGTYFEKRKARALALTSVNQGIGALIFAPIIVLLHKEYNSSGTFFIISAVFAHSFISAALFRPLSSKSNLYSKKIIKKIKEGQRHLSMDSSYKNINRDQSTEPLCSENLGSQSSHILCSTCPTNQNGPKDSQNNDSNHHKLDHSPTTSMNNIKDDTTNENTYCQKSSFTSEDRESDVVHLRGNNGNHSRTDIVEPNNKPNGKSPPVVVAEPQKKKFLAMFKSVISAEYIVLCLAMYSNLASTATATQFTPALVIEQGMDMSEAAMLVSITGAAFVLGTLILGSLLDVPLIRPHRLYIYSICVFVTGISTMALPLCFTLATMAVPISFGSATAAVVYTQIVTVLSDLVGRDNVPAGFGFLRIAGALGALTGRVVGGILVDTLGRNSLSFYIFGSLPVILSLLLFLALARRDRRKGATSERTPPI